MSLHSQLLRGVLALPVMLLLAIAGVIAPDTAPSRLPAHDLPVATGDVPVMLGATQRAACLHHAVRCNLPVDDVHDDACDDNRGDASIMRGCSMSSSTSPKSRPTPAT